MSESFKGEINESQKTDVNESDLVDIPTNFVRLRGLPFSSTEDDIRGFLSGVSVQHITLTTTHDGRVSGEAFCELGSKDQVKEALKFHKKEMKTRYIEVFTVKPEEITTLKHRGVISDEGKIVRMRGLPFSATENEIKDFFKGLDCEEVVIGRTGGRPSGEAFVCLATKEQASKALDFNRQNMGSRYIEVFRTTSNDMERHRGPDAGMVPYGRSHNGIPSLLELDNNRFYGAVPPRRDDHQFRHSPYRVPSRPPMPRESGGGGWGAARGGGGGGGDYYSPTRVYMRGLPFDADAYSIEAFFNPLKCLEIKIGINEQNRPSGEACVEFGTMAEAQEAMGRNKQHMGNRYVELYSADDVPPMIRRLQWKTVSGHPAPAPQPLSRYDGGAYGATFGGYDDYNSYDSAPAPGYGYAARGGGARFGPPGQRGRGRAPPSRGSGGYGMY